MIVVEWYTIFVQERKQIVLMATQTLDQTISMFVVPIGIDQFCKAFIESFPTTDQCAVVDFITFFP
jgi:hypothetical protein